MTIMIRGELLEKLDHLVNEEGFRTREDLLSLAVSIGLFLDETAAEGHVGDMSIELTSLPNWPLLQVVVHDRDPSLLSFREMESYLEPYMDRGLETIQERVGSRRGLKALSALAELLPP